MALMLPVYDETNRRYKKWPYFYQMVKPGLDIALEKITEDQILPNYHANFTHMDTRCLNPQAQIDTVNLRYESNCDVFFGPACEYATAPSARFCNYWKVPQITAGALSAGFSSKSTFRTLTRLQGPYDKFGLVVVDLFILHNWAVTGLLYDHDPNGEIADCYFCMGGISMALDGAKDKEIQQKVVQFKESNLDKDLHKILGDIQLSVRSKYKNTTQRLYY